MPKLKPAGLFALCLLLSLSLTAAAGTGLTPADGQRLMDLSLKADPLIGLSK
jgi:hypothetical protein